VLGVDSVPPAPVLASAAFSTSGAQIVVSFEGATNMAGLGAVFACPTLLNFYRPSAATCAWTDPATIVITLTAGAAIMPGQNITLLGGRASHVTPMHPLAH
jgi:hypothetical protein